MESVLEGGEHLEQELAREPFAGPAAGSVGLASGDRGDAGVLRLGHGLFHHNFWGTAGSGGSMQVTLTSALPLPADQINQNVLATETPARRRPRRPRRNRKTWMKRRFRFWASRPSPRPKTFRRRKCTSRSPSRTWRST